ncbi:hypothetical protein PMAYCL1PPCAC_15122, partial [Pristionchus mayeri]
LLSRKVRKFQCMYKILLVSSSVNRHFDSVDWSQNGFCGKLLRRHWPIGFKSESSQQPTHNDFLFVLGEFLTYKVPRSRREWNVIV